eukprot:scaffold913_cov431-Prasinococcus_capsulatus_cf.AAC.1
MVVGMMSAAAPPRPPARKRERISSDQTCSGAATLTNQARPEGKQFAGVGDMRFYYSSVLLVVAHEGGHSEARRGRQPKPALQADSTCGPHTGCGHRVYLRTAHVSAVLALRQGCPVALSSQTPRPSLPRRASAPPRPAPPCALGRVRPQACGVRVH